MNYSTTWQNQISREAADQDSSGAAAATLAEEPDARLVRLTLEGDKAAFEQIFERYKRLVASVAYYYFQRPEQVEEIIQITFTKVYFELEKFSGEHEYSLAGWLKRIAANACIDVLRKQKRKPENLSCELSGENDLENSFAATDLSNKSIEDCLAERDLAEKLLKHLDPEDRALLAMFYADGMTFGEIREATGWSGAKIKIRVFRARKKLRGVLKKYL